MRAVFAMRLAVYGTVAVLAAVILAVRMGDDSKARSTGALYHGQTPEGLLAAAAVRDGKVRSVYMRWRMTCERDRTPDISTIRFGEQYGDRFAYRGRSYSFAGGNSQTIRTGYVTRYRVEIGGTLSPDGRTVTGHGRTTETWLRDGRVVDTCRSKDVTFTAHRGKVVVNP